MSKQPRLLRAQLAPGPGKGAQWGSGGARRGGDPLPGLAPVLKLRQLPGAGCPLPPLGLFFYICKLPINIRGQILLPTPSTPHTASQKLVPGKHRGAAGRRGLQGAPQLARGSSGGEGWQGFPHFSQFPAGHTLPGTPAQSPGCCPEDARGQTLQLLPCTKAPCAGGPAGIWGDPIMSPFSILLLGPALRPERGCQEGTLALSLHPSGW